MEYPWFAPKMQVFESGNVQDMCGEDVSFCLDAKEMGYDIWCDPRIRVGHEKTRVIWGITIMAIMKGGSYVKGTPKKTRQGRSQYTLLSATSRNKAKKKYRGQGK